MDETQVPQEAHRNTILVVDDDPGVLFLAEEVFLQDGYKVVCASSGEEALSLISEVDPDIVLLDIMMPGIDGFETCLGIKSTPGFEHTPVIMLTGREDVAAVERAYEAGAWDFSQKPINWPMVQYRVRYGLRASQAFANERQAARLSKTLDNSSNEILLFNAHSLKIVSANASALINLGYRASDITKLTIADIVEDTTREDLASKLANLANHQQLAMHLELRRQNGTVYSVEAIILFAADDKPYTYIGIFQDITERKRAEEKLHQLAFFDDLTGLPNRRLFKQNVGNALASAKRNGSECAVCILDLDGFKQVNDALGHSVGDLLLKQVSDRLASKIRSYDTIASTQSESDLEAEVELARLGGDEFLLLLTGFDNNTVPATVADRILKAVSLPYNVHGQELTITCSIGIALYPEDGDSLDVLMRHADNAMYSAKNAGKNNYAYYSRETGKNSLERLTLQTQLRSAVNHGELELMYQPQVQGSQGKVVGAEALLRWRHPEKGLLYPPSFLPLAEETGLIIPIGEWVLEEAVRQIDTWAHQFDTDFKCAVNLSAHQLRQDEFLSRTRELLTRRPVARGRLVMELTESAIMSSAQSRIDWLQDVKDMGVEIAIDDFGTGYSSLSYLTKFPIDYLKIDRSFVASLDAKESDEVIVNTIFSMARALGLQVVAEGVETWEQLRMLERMGPCLIQGFLYSEAVSPKELERFVAEHAARVNSGSRIIEQNFA